MSAAKKINLAACGNQSNNLRLETLEPRLLLSTASDVAQAALDAEMTTVTSSAGQFDFSGQLVSGAFKLYGLTVQSNSHLVAQMHGDQDLDSGLTLWELDAKGILRSRKTNNNAAPGTLDSAMAFDLQVGKTYYVQASAAKAEGSYTLSLSTTPIDETGGDVSSAMLQKLSGGGSANARGQIDYAGDVDVYGFVATRSGVMLIQQGSLTRGDTAQYQLQAYDGQGELLYTSTGTAGAALVYFEVVQGQTYYVETSRGDDGFGGYQLQYRTLTSDQGGDSLDEASQLALSTSGKGAYKSRMDVADDNDFFSFLAPVDGVMSLSFMGLGKNAIDSLSVNVFDADGHLIASKTGSSQRAVTEMRFNVAAAQQYFVQAFDARGQIGDYTFKLTTLPVDEAGGDVDSAALAQLNTKGAGIIRGLAGLAGDVDFYSFVATQTGRIEIDARNLGKDAFQSTLAAYDADGQQTKAGSDVDSDGREELTLGVVAGQTYRIAIAAAAGQFGSYMLNLRTLPDGAPQLRDMPQLGGASGVTDEEALDLWQYASDTETAAEDLSYSVDTDGPLTIEIHGNRWLSVTPAGGFEGQAHLTVHVSDGVSEAQQTVTVLVVDLNNPPEIDPDGYCNGTSEDEARIIDYGYLSNGVKAKDNDGDSIWFHLESVICGTLTKDGLPAISGQTWLKPGESWLWVPPANINGKPQAFSIRAWDGKAFSRATSTVRVLVVAVNDAPVAGADTATTDEDRAVTINVLANDSDVDGDALSVTQFTQPGHGSLVSTGNGQFTYTPAADYNGSDSFTYTISDGNGGTAQGTVAITINPVNDAPHATSTATLGDTDEDTPLILSYDYLLNAIGATDADGDALTLRLESLIGGTLTKNGELAVAGQTTLVQGEQWMWTPPANGYGQMPVMTVRASDGRVNSPTTTVSTTVASVNDAPAAADDSVSTAAGQSRTVNPLANDSDVDGDSLTITDFSQGDHGSVAYMGEGLLRYTPETGFYGTDSFSYTTSDGHGGTTQATVTMTVGLVNTAPTAADDTLTTNEDIAAVVIVLSNDSDTDGDTLVVSSFAEPEHGSVAYDGEGQFSYTPAAGYSGDDSFTYSISDGQGGTAQATVNIHVRPVNDAPVAEANSGTTSEDAVLSIDVLDNDSDADGDSLTVSAFTQAGHGSVSYDGNGQFSYTPAGDYYGSDSFTYTVSDGHGGTAQAVVSITITPVNDAPVALSDTASTSEDHAVTVSVLGNDSDVDGDSLTISQFSQGSHGSVAYNGDGQFAYTPGANYFGSDSFTYTIRDGQGGTAQGTVNVTISPVNDAPLAPATALLNGTNEDTPRIISYDYIANGVGATDADGDAISFRLESLVCGTMTKNGQAVVPGQTTIAPGEQWIWTPPANINGEPVVMTVTASDGQSSAGITTVNIRVFAVNDAPVGAGDSLSTSEDQAKAVNVLGNDSDAEGDSLSISTFNQPAHGSVTYDGNGQFTYTPTSGYHGTDSFTYTLSDGNGGTAEATVSITVASINHAPVAANDALTISEDHSGNVNVLGNDSDPDSDSVTISQFSQPSHGSVTQSGAGQFTYAPNANYNGSDSFTYTISDGHGGTAQATVNVTITSVNDAPAAAGDTLAATEDQPATVNVLTNDTDIDGDSMTVSTFTQPTHGSVSRNGGQFSYTAAANYNGSDSFTYTISDGHGGTAQATVTITVAAVNDAPTAAADTLAVTENQPATLNVLTNDVDVDGDALTVSQFSQPSHGSITQNGGQFSYTPAAGYNGSDSFTYTVSDGHGGTAQATVDVTIAAVNDAPTAAGDTLAATEDQPATVNVLTNDGDVDGDSLTISTFTQPSHGSVTRNGGQFTYAPAANYNGSDSFTYTISDGHGGTAQATVTIAVAAVNDGPTASGDTLATNQDTAATISVLANDSDADGDSLSISTFTQPSHGSVTQNGGQFTYTPASGYTGADSFTYTISDGHGGTSQAAVNVTVQAVVANAIYVAPWGSDTAAGTFAAPFATLDKAASSIRTIKTTTGLPVGGITVYLRGGVYQRSTTLTLGSSDSGTAACPIVYKAYNNEAVDIIGGKTVGANWFSTVTSADSAWSKVSAAARGNLVEVDLTAHSIDLGQMKNRAGWGWNNGAPTELFFNGAAMQLGRSEGWLTITSASGATFTYSNDVGDKWATAEDAWFSGLFGTYWFNASMGGTVNAATNTVTAKTTPQYGFKAGQPYYAFNMLEEIDRPGEYYINRSTGKMYLWAPDSIDASDQIYVSQMDGEVLKLNSTQYITFEGITFEAGRGALVNISGGAHNQLYNCTVRNSGTNGVNITGTDNGILSSRVYDVGETAVSLSGGTRSTLTAAGNYVRNSDIYRWGRWVSTSRTGINLDGVGNIVSHNEMHDASHTAIWFFGNNNVIEYNDIYNVCNATSDAGAIYAGRDWSLQGNVVQYNFIHDMSSPFTPWQLFGIYLDDCASGITVRGNIIADVHGFAMINAGGRWNHWDNNIAYDCYGGMRSDRRGVDIITNISGDDCNFLQKLNTAAGGNFRTGAWAAAYPWLLELPATFDQLGDYKNPGETTFTHNIGYGNTSTSANWMSDGTWGGTGSYSWWSDVSNNLYGQNPQFVDPANGNFNLKSTSPALAIPGFDALPFDQMGILENASPVGTAVVVDNLDAGFSKTGTWSEASALDEYDNSSLSTTQAGSTATWSAALPEAGTYQVWAWWAGKKLDGTAYNRDSSVSFNIAHADGTSVVTVDEDTAPGQWVLLGLFDFLAGQNGLVTLVYDGSDLNAASADALKFVLM